MWIVLLMYALFASVLTVGKHTLQSVDPFFLTGIRMLIAGFILLIYQLITNRKKIYLPKKLIFLVCGLAVFNVFITNAFEFWGLQYMETAKTSLIYSFSPFFAILLSYLFFKEKMSTKKWIGLVVGVIGFSLIFWAPGQERRSLFGPISLPEIAVSISAFTCVVGWIIMKRLITKYNYPFMTANTFSFLIAGVLSLISSVFVESWQPIPVSSFYPFLFGMLYIAIIHNVICYNLYGWSLKRFSVSFMVFAGFSNPPFTAIFGWFFLEESVAPTFFISLALIIIGIFIYSHEEIVLRRALGKYARDRSEK